VVRNGQINVRNPSRSENEWIEFLEARVGIEPTHKGFADLSLTTWVPRLVIERQCELAPESINPRRGEGQMRAKYGAGDGS
jgi:hypothetical protein